MVSWLVNKLIGRLYAWMIDRVVDLVCWLAWMVGGIHWRTAMWHKVTLLRLGSWGVSITFLFISVALLVNLGLSRLQFLAGLQCSNTLLLRMFQIPFVQVR